MRFFYLLVLFISLNTQAQTLGENYLFPHFKKQPKTLIVCTTDPKMKKMKYRIDIKTYPNPIFENREDKISADVHMKPSKYSMFVERHYLDHESFVEKQIEHFYDDDGMSIQIKWPQFSNDGSISNPTTPARSKTILRDGSKIYQDLICSWKETYFLPR
ncbi:MAG: hypothetical protein RJB66_188 [Pseudomonadota bacterium]|jgi:hypothetical protein